MATVVVDVDTMVLELALGHCSSFGFKSEMEVACGVSPEFWSRRSSFSSDLIMDPMDKKKNEGEILDSCFKLRSEVLMRGGEVSYG